MRASFVPGGAGTISGIASTTCGGDHVRVRRACLRCPHLLVPRAALLSKRVKATLLPARQDAARPRVAGDPMSATPGGPFGRGQPSRIALSANGSVRTADCPELLCDLYLLARPMLVRNMGPSFLNSPPPQRHDRGQRRVGTPCEMNGLSGCRALRGRPWRPHPPTWLSHWRCAPQMPRDRPGAAPFPGLSKP
jgi:hypothetical protein